MSDYFSPGGISCNTSRHGHRSNVQSNYRMYFNPYLKILFSELVRKQYFGEFDKYYIHLIYEQYILSRGMWNAESCTDIQIRFF